MKPKSRRLVCLLPPLFLLLVTCACGDSDGDSTRPAEASEPPANEGAPTAAAEDEHEHEPLGTVTIGDLSVELAQGHGPVVAGEEAHLVVRLPYSDGGSTIVRAWIGTQDRTLSLVGKGEYASSHDDYDVHATAPDPLPESCAWWIEIEKPDGSKLLGSAEPILE